jgi:hypothetical protein
MPADSQTIIYKKSANNSTGFFKTVLLFRFAATTGRQVASADGY